MPSDSLTWRSKAEEPASAIGRQAPVGNEGQGRRTGSRPLRVQRARRDGLAIFVLLWGLAVVTPPVLLAVYGAAPAVTAGVAIPALWMCVTPCTCQTGGLGAASMSSALILGGLGWILYGVVSGIAWLWNAVVR